MITFRYTSFLQPVTASKLYNDVRLLYPLLTKLLNINLALDLTWSWFQVKAHKDIAHFETAYVVKMHNVARLAPTQPVSKFSWSLVFFQSIQSFDVCLVQG